MQALRNFTLVVLAGTLILFARAAQPEKATMKAVVLRSYGGPEVAKLEEVPRPEPKDDEILIRVVAASVNPVDIAIQKGYLAELIGNKFPLIIGMDAAGTSEKNEPKH